MGYIAEQNKENELTYNMAVRASWIDEEGDRGKQLKFDAVQFYMKEIFDGKLSDLLIFADVARMATEFDTAKAFTNAAKELAVLSNKKEFMIKVCNYELDLIEKKDKARHNLSEVEK